MKRAFTTGAALAGLAVLGVGAAGPAGAAGAAPVKYGAISYSPSANSRWFYNNLPAGLPTGSGEVARNAAVGLCVTKTHRADCADNWIAFKGNTWGALAVGSNKKFGLGVGNGKELAKLNALQKCNSTGATGCKVVLAVPSAGSPSS